MASTVIVGLGLSGLACALELTRRDMSFVAFEKESRPGGLARTDAVDGFQFDRGPHILLKVPRELASLFAALPGLDLVDRSGRSCIAFGAGLAHVVPVPFQRNLNWLPFSERFRILYDLTVGKTPRQPVSYREFAIERCGERVFELFLDGYESKRLRFSLDDIPPDWTARIDVPSLRSLLSPRRTAASAGNGQAESQFQYPRSGGIEALPRAIAAMLPQDKLHCGNPLVEIDLRARQVVLAHGAPVPYEHLVLSLPLPEIVRLIKDPPEALTRAAAHLIYASVYVVSFGIEGQVPPWTVMRFPGPDVGFYRLSIPSAYADGIAPEGASVVMTEISHHPTRHPISPRQAVDQCREGLMLLGLITGKQKILVERIEDIRYAHVIWNQETRSSVRFILDYLKDRSVFACGKYGQWRDMLMTHSMLSGTEAAREIDALIAAAT